MMAVSDTPEGPSKKLQNNLTKIESLNGAIITQADETRYLGIHIDRRLAWRNHIWTKKKQLSLKWTYWQKVSTIDGKQSPCVQNHNYTDMYVRNSSTEEENFNGGSVMDDPFVLH